MFCLYNWLIYCRFINLDFPPYNLFFFQAEDGIRDLVRSRGLGDVYKRQVASCPTAGQAPIPPRTWAGQGPHHHGKTTLQLHIVMQQTYLYLTRY